jgi:hypothetical protein
MMRLLIFCLVGMSLLSCREAASHTPVTDPAVAEVEGALDHYFTAWSEGDMEAYGATFLPEAVIQQRQADGSLLTLARDPFVAGQLQAKSGQGAAMREHPLSKKVQISPDGMTAHAAVHWKLVDGPRTQTGWDHFTLLRDAGEWRILHLLFYAE